MSDSVSLENIQSLLLELSNSNKNMCKRLDNLEDLDNRPSKRLKLGTQKQTVIRTAEFREQDIFNDSQASIPTDQQQRASIIMDGSSAERVLVSDTAGMSRHSWPIFRQ